MISIRTDYCYSGFSATANKNKLSLGLIFLFIFLTSSVSADNSKRFACLTGNTQDAIKACEDFVNAGQDDYFIFLKLARYYKMKNRLTDAQVIYEKALSAYSDSTLLKGDAANLVSNMQEQEWLKENSLSFDDAAVLRGKCINLSKILPKKALPACTQYLKNYPQDEEVIKHRKIAGNKLGLPENELAIKQDMEANLESDSNSKNLPGDSKPIETIELKPDQVDAVDPNVIADLRSELNQLYKIIDSKNNNSKKQVEYSEKGDRYALVIGNSNYTGEIPVLKNPVNDAKDMSNVLKRLGFDVSLITDASLQKMEQEVDKLSSKMNVNDIVLFYYAGHGVAINGRNYLLPAKTVINDEVDVKHKSLTASYVLEKLKRIGNGMTLVVLDACRNNPFPEAKRGARVIDGGLVNVSGYGGSLIAYATAPENVAIDGNGRNGVYTKHLIEHISKPNLKLEDMFKRVRVAVQNETDGMQTPWENSSLTDDFYFYVQK